MSARPSVRGPEARSARSLRPLRGAPSRPPGPLRSARGFPAPPRSPGPPSPREGGGREGVVASARLSGTASSGVRAVQAPDYKSRQAARRGGRRRGAGAPRNRWDFWDFESGFWEARAEIPCRPRGGLRGACAVGVFRWAPTGPLGRGSWPTPRAWSTIPPRPHRPPAFLQPQRSRRRDRAHSGPGSPGLGEATQHGLFLRRVPRPSCLSVPTWDLKTGSADGKA